MLSEYSSGKESICLVVFVVVFGFVALDLKKPLDLILSTSESIFLLTYLYCEVFTVSQNCDLQTSWSHGRRYMVGRDHFPRPGCSELDHRRNTQSKDSTVHSATLHCHSLYCLCTWTIWPEITRNVWLNRLFLSLVNWRRPRPSSKHYVRCSWSLEVLDYVGCQPQSKL